MSDNTRPLSGWCKRGEHRVCSGILHMATGPRTYCICDCHPEPDAAEYPAGYEQWIKDRA